MTGKENKFKEFNCVSIKKPVRAFGSKKEYKDFPVGSIGTIVDSYIKEYWVEFCGDPAEDGFIYKYYQATIKEEDLEFYCEY